MKRGHERINSTKELINELAIREGTKINYWVRDH